MRRENVSVVEIVTPAGQRVGEHLLRKVSQARCVGAFGRAGVDEDRSERGAPNARHLREPHGRAGPEAVGIGNCSA